MIINSYLNFLDKVMLCWLVRYFSSKTLSLPSMNPISFKNIKIASANCFMRTSYILMVTRQTMKFSCMNRALWVVYQYFPISVFLLHNRGVIISLTA